MWNNYLFSNLLHLGICVCVTYVCICIYVICACWQLIQLKTTRYELARGDFFVGLRHYSHCKNCSQSQFKFFVCVKPAQTKQVPFCKVQGHQGDVEALWRPHRQSVAEPDLNSEVPGLWPGAEASRTQLYWIVNRMMLSFSCMALWEQNWFN